MRKDFVGSFEELVYEQTSCYLGEERKERESMILFVVGVATLPSHCAMYHFPTFFHHHFPRSRSSCFSSASFWSVVLHMRNSLRDRSRPCVASGPESLVRHCRLRFGARFGDCSGDRHGHCASVDGISLFSTPRPTYIPKCQSVRWYTPQNQCLIWLRHVQTPDLKGIRSIRVSCLVDPDLCSQVWNTVIAPCLVPDESFSCWLKQSSCSFVGLT